MEIIVNDTAWTIKFNYRVMQALLTKVGISTLNDLSKLADKVGTGNLHVMIATAIKESARTKENKNPKGCPTDDDILFSMEDDAAIAADFFKAFSEGVAAIFPTDDAVAVDATAGN